MVLVSLLISYTIAYQVNIRKENLCNGNPYFGKEENPLFTSNTSLTFNWEEPQTKFKL
jgi:hypothetical protein